VLTTSRVAWKEGLFLQPQHFQQCERSVVALVNDRLALLNPHAAGLADIAFDADALASSLLSVTRCRGVLGDGTAFALPSDGPLPPARSCASHFALEQATLDVYLALAVVQEGRANAVEGSNAATGPTRFRSVSVDIGDDTLGRPAKPIDVLQPCFSIRFGSETLDGHACMRIARLTRAADGQVNLDTSCAPPLLHIAASPWLLGEVRSVLQLVMARIHAFSAGRRQAGGGLATFGANEETSYRMLHTLNTYTPLLTHYLHAPQVHPWELYCVLSQFCGSLCTFSAESDIGQVPRYDHDDLSATFGGLFALVRGVLGVDFSSGCTSVPLQQVSRSTYACSVSDERLLASGRFYLGLAARMPEKELVVGALQRIKMSSRERLDLLIASAMPGLALMHVPKPPDALAAKPGFVYFALGQQGELWDGIRTGRSIAFHFPNEFPELKLEVLALRS
jgi:type VI secretion system protein ImpJ